MQFRRIVMALVACCLPALAEFRHVAILYAGEECASCAASMTKGIARLRGVSSVSVDNRKSSIAIELAAGNRVPLTDIGDAIKRVGFTPGEARVLVRGSLVRDGSKRLLKPHGLEQAYDLAGDGAPETGSVVVEGVMRSPQSTTIEVLAATSARPE